MKHLLISASILFISIPCLAAEGYMCDFYYDAVKRKADSIERNTDLSGLARNKLYEDLTHEIKQCFNQCETMKFDYCNRVAKKIERN